jgi:hypothetical protein
MWPIAAAVAPLPTALLSTIAVRNPRVAHSRAQAAPTMPAPTTTTSHLTLIA